MRADTVRTAGQLSTVVQCFNETTIGRLRAKYFPSSSEIPEIESFVCSAETTLATYNEEIEQSRELTIRAMENARGLTAPIRKLAPETLHQIFSYYIDNSLRDVGSSIESITPTTELPYPNICLTSVCMFWRDLVLARPSLWTTILISIPMLLRNPNRLHLLRHYLVQSATLSLDIVIVHEKNRGRMNDKSCIQKMYDTLIETRLRWGRFTSFFDLYGELDLYNLFAPAADFPNLKYLHGSGLAPFQLLCSCPQLQSYRGAQLDFGQHIEDHLFSTLIELVITEVKSYYTITDLLRRMPLLEKLVLTYFSHDGRGGRGAGTGADTSSYASKISTMSLSLSAIKEMADWELLQLPCLSTLELGSLTPWRIIPESYCHAIERFSKLLCDTGSILRTLKLDRIPNKQVLAFLALHPSISDLTICMLYHNPMFVFDALDISRKDTAIVLPNLCSLSISMNASGFDDPPEMVENGICQIVKSRTTASICESKGVVRLKNFALETQFRGSDVGKAICAGLSDKMATLEKESIDFRLEGGD